MHGGFAERNDGLLLSEQAHDGILSQQQQGTGDQRIHQTHAQGDPHPLFHAVQTACAVVLAYKGGGRHADAADRQDVEAVDLHIGGKSGHGGGTVAVHAGLHQYVGKGNDHVLDAGGQAHPDDARGHLFVPLDLPQGHLVVILHPHQKAQAQHAGHQLTDVGGNGGTRHAHLQAHDEHQVQHDVGHGRPGQVDQGPAGVPGGVQNAGGHIVHDAEQHAAKIDADVGHSVVQHLSGGVHPDQQCPAAGHAADGQEQAHHHRDGQGGVHGFLGLFAVSGPQELGHDHTGTHGHALAEADEQIDGGAAGTHRRQGVGAHEIANDDAVGGIVQLLQKIAEDERHRKQQNAFGDAALGHAAAFWGCFNSVCHRKTPFDAMDFQWNPA